jgi:TonB family protein
MALTGQLSDMSLAELIEFFCNQRKTGRLKIDYPRGHSVFFIKEGELVDAKVGALSGADAVYFSLTLPNAAFDFSPDVQATRRTIDQAWTQVVLEGLRRLDEGLSPTEADAFGTWSPSESEFAQMLDQVEHLGNADQQKQREKRQSARAAAPAESREESALEEAAAKETSKETSKESRGESSPEPFSMMVESAGAAGGSKKKFVLAGVAAAVVLACAVAAVPLLSSPAAKPPAEAAAAPAETKPAEAPPAEAAPAEANPEAGVATAPEADAAAAEAARREERERRERERRERERREEAAAKKEDAALNTETEAAAAPKPAAPAGPKSVRVSITYDEAGRVTQASVAGSTPGAEAYGSTAVRIARGKRFPAGKPGSTVITIPVN